MCTLIRDLLACVGTQLTQVVVPPMFRSVPQLLKSLEDIPIFPSIGILPKRQHFERPKYRHKWFHFKCSWSPRSRQSDSELMTHRVKATHLYNHRLNEEQVLSCTRKTIFVQRMLIKYIVQNAFAFTYYWARLRVWFLRTDSSFE